MLTTSLAGAHGTIASILAEGLLARAANRAERLYVLACENGVTSIQLRQSVLQHMAAAAQEIDAAADFIPCVVDRVCDAIKTKSDRVVVRAELFGRLSLPATYITPRIKTLSE
jgi:mannitol-1-phosphate/altronate dehydrogenase